jgi:3D (Asp-Asp-Asp) domain-containing protein
MSNSSIALAKEKGRRRKRHTFWFIFLLLGLLLLPQIAFGNRDPYRAPRSVQAIVTAYTSSRSGLTASGTLAFDGAVACPRKYPFGTRFKIQGRIYNCQDRLNSKYENRFDIWKPSKTAARAFGRRKLTLVLVSEPRSRAG